MPSTFACPSDAKPEPSTTHYRAFVGKGAVFEQGKSTKLAEILDGSSNTLMVVEAKEGVPWTKPDDLSFEAAAALPFYGAGSIHPGGFNALFANGAVRFMKTSVDQTLFHALITRAGGEVIKLDSH